MERVDANLISKGPCSACGSSDACASYDDGHTHCYSCGHRTYENDTQPARTKRLGSDLLTGEPRALTKRGVSEETCRKFGYWVGTHQGHTVQIANYRRDGAIVAQKVRDAGKGFRVFGDGHDMPLYGQHLWSGKGRRIVITEGEVDALSVAEATGRTWDVVSLPNGAQSARRALQKALEWLLGYETIVLAFDDDEPGRDAAAACADLFPPGRCAVATYEGFKDSNELLLADNGVARLNKALWNAKTHRPDGVVTLVDVRERAMRDPEQGFPYPFKGLQQVTYGRRPGDVIGLGAASGAGKTDWMTTMIAHDLKMGLKVGVIYLEMPVDEVVKRIAGKLVGKLFHVPGEATKQELSDAIDLIPADSLLLYDSFGVCEWEVVQSRLRYMAAQGVQVGYLDHLTALAAASEDERRELEKIMAEMASLAKACGIILHFVSHLATPAGDKGHEDGAKIQAKHFRGSRAIIFWSHLLLGLERDQQADEADTRMVCLKDRYTGRATGKSWFLSYDSHTGLLHEAAETLSGDDGETPF